MDLINFLSVDLPQTLIFYAQINLLLIIAMVVCGIGAFVTGAMVLRDYFKDKSK